MNRTFKFIIALIFCAMMLPMVAKAQQMPPLPVDPEVRIGHLPNGLTYYIRHNEYPKGQADFYIAQKVGSVLEDDHQRGLAHFLEHMCFNGTKNFPGNTMVQWCESVGIKYGRNLNAYTAFDQTVYNISSVAVGREGVQDSCLMILHDWADDLLLEGEEIEKERGVIHQEWRTTNSGPMRLYEQMLPNIFPNNPYGVRLPIGTMDVVDNFEHKALRDYYEKWYRPDLQGVIVVGDIDVDRIENKIKELFGPIQMPENPAERKYFEVADNEGTIIQIGHDKEVQAPQVQLMFKSDVMPAELKGTPMFYIQNYVEYMIDHMLNARLDEMSSKSDAKFATAGISHGNFLVAKTKDELKLTVIPKDGNVKEGLAAVYREFLRAARHGFTPGEFNRAKDEYISHLEKAYNNRASRTNNEFVQDYVNNFLDNEPIPPIDVEYQLGLQITQMIPLDAINQTLAEAYKECEKDNRVLMALLPDNEAGIYPTETELLETLNSVDAENIEPFEDNVKTEPLIAKLPKPGKVVKTQQLPEWNAVEWTLSNGAKVIAKKTNFKEDEILFNAVEVGKGTSQFGKDYLNSKAFMPLALRQLGLGTYTANDMQKYLSGKQANIDLALSDYTATVSGSTTPKDLPTLMELIYMGFTAPNLDEEEFTSLQNTYASILQNQESNPQFQFQKYLVEALFPSGERAVMTADAVANAKREQVLEMMKNVTSNAADYTFVFVGNFDEAQLKTLVEQYIATIPGNAKTAVHGVANFNPALAPKGGTGIDRKTTAMETPQTWVYILDFATMPYSSKDAKTFSAIGQILSKRLIETVREREGAVYSISADGSMGRIGEPNSELSTGFPMKPEMEEKVLKMIADEIKAMETNITDDELAPVREYTLKEIASAREKNSGWLGLINGWAINGVDSWAGAEEMWNNMTVADVMQLLKKLNAAGNYRVVVLAPEEAAAAE